MRRGDVYWITNEGSTGCEMAGKRPALIVSNDMCNQHSQTFQMVPLTTKRKKPLPTHVSMFLNGCLNTVLCEHICDVSTERLCEFMGRLDEKNMQAVDRALRVQLGL